MDAAPAAGNRDRGERSERDWPFFPLRGGIGSHEDHFRGSRLHGVREQHHRRLHAHRAAARRHRRAVRHQPPAPAGVEGDAGHAERQHQRSARHHRDLPGHRGAQGSAARRRLRGQRHPGGRLRAEHGDRLRGAEAVRAAADHRRHARHRRHLPGPAHHSGDARLRPRHGGGGAGRLAAQLHQSDGDGHRRGAARNRRARGGAVPLGAGVRPAPARTAGHGARSGGHQVADRRHQSPGVAAGAARRRRRPVPGGEGARRGHEPGRAQRQRQAYRHGAFRDDAPLRLLRHRVVGAQRRVLSRTGSRAPTRS